MPLDGPRRRAHPRANDESRRMSKQGISRREALKLGAASIAATVAAPAAFVDEAIATPAPRLPAFVVGTPGEFDWIFVRAATAEAAKRAWLDENGHCHKDHCEADECACKGWDEADACEHCFAPDIDAERAESLDEVDNPTPGDWIRAGFGHTCSRCSYETCGDAGGQGVGDEAVCGDCMTLDDWDAIDPAHAAELRAELADE